MKSEEIGKTRQQCSQHNYCEASRCPLVKPSKCRLNGISIEYERSRNVIIKCDIIAMLYYNIISLLCSLRAGLLWFDICQICIGYVGIMMHE